MGDEAVDQDWLSAGAATARLGVKAQTLYAYVSRGLVRRERVAGSRSSRYSRTDVELLAARARRTPRPSGTEIVIDTAITEIDPVGRLWYRGWDATRAAQDTHYEEVAAWLWGATVGPHEHWTPAPAALRLARRVQAALPSDTPLPDRLRVSVAALRAQDPLRDDRRVTSVAARAGTLLATLVEALPAAGPRADTVDAGSVAGRLWARVSPLEPTAVRVRALDIALSLLADHELATSTLAARVAASTWADPYLVVLAGLAAVGGPLHGGASELVRRLLRTAVDSSAAVAVGEALRDGAVHGFGHMVYEGPDPRAPILLDAIARSRPPRELWRVALQVQEVVAREDGPSPNVDFALGVLAEATQMVSGSGELIFAIARCAGWIAHGLEEYTQQLRYRVRAAYTGPRRDG